MLRLGGNAIGDQGVAALAEQLPVLPLLSKLFVHETKMTDAGCYSLLERFAESQLKECYLHGNTISRKCKIKMQAAETLDTMCFF